MELLDDDSLSVVAGYLRSEDGCMFAPTCRRTWNLFAKYRTQHMKPRKLHQFTPGDVVHYRFCPIGIVHSKTKHFLRIRNLKGSIFLKSPALTCRIMKLPDPSYVSKAWRCAWCIAMTTK